MVTSKDMAKLYHNHRYLFTYVQLWIVHWRLLARAIGVLGRWWFGRLVPVTLTQ